MFSHVNSNIKSGSWRLNSIKVFFFFKDEVTVRYFQKKCTHKAFSNRVPIILSQPEVHVMLLHVNSNNKTGKKVQNINK